VTVAAGNASLVRELFDEIADLDEDARTARLAERGIADEAVLSELDALLAADRVTGEQPLLSPGWLERLGVAAQSRVGQRAGDYVLTELLGSGGMGDVYLADRAGGDFEQKVAIKLVRRDLASPAVTRRFEEERRILARLRHPSIATLFGGGVTDDGRPYLVMEYVDGVPLDRFCSERELGTERRVALVAEVCRAVAHAHARRTVHCDLKPDNILVTAAGEVKLLDFGIATALESDQPGPNTAMTPSYAAPEVLEQTALGTAADVYSLGVLLYRLVSGQLPHPIDDGGLTQRAAMLRETPMRPLAASRDLDAICRRALAPAPEDRYASVAALADDLDRALERRPVTARPRSVRYVAGRFVQRHTVATLAAAAVVAAIAALVAFYTLRLAGERDRARAESARALAVSDVAVGMLTAVDPTEVRGEPLSARDLLLHAERRVDDALAAYPDERRRLLAVLGQVHRNLGHSADAERLARAALADARRRGDDDAVDAALANLGDALREQSQLDEAQQVLREALTRADARHGRDSLAAARPRLNLAAALEDAGEYDDALVLAEEALAIHRARGAGDEELADALGAVAGIQAPRGEYVIAGRLSREALAASVAASGEVHPYSASLTLDVGYALRKQGRFDEAEPFYRRALALRETLYPGDHADVAHSLNHLARLLHQQGKPAPAEPIYRRALEMRRRLYPGGHAAVGASLGGLAQLLEDLGRVDEAVPLARESYEMMLALHGDEHPYTAGALGTYAALVGRAGDRPRAIELYRRSLALLRRTSAAPIRLGGALFNLGRMLCDGDSAAERAEGRAMLEESRAIHDAALPDGNPVRDGVAAGLAACTSGPRPGAARPAPTVQ
jgi:serine/threonine-protein kinase